MKKILLVPAALMALTFTACRETTSTEDAAHADDTAVLVPNGNPTAADHLDAAGDAIQEGASNTAAAVSEWTDVDYNGPVVKWDEVGDKDIETRGTDKYGVYSLGENVLFASGSADLSATAKAKIKKVAASINTRYKESDIRIMGFADASGSADMNAELSKKRAEAVKAELISSGLNVDKVSVSAMGESKPVATNDTKTGMKENRRVQIVAHKA